MFFDTYEAILVQMGHEDPGVPTLKKETYTVILPSADSLLFIPDASLTAMYDHVKAQDAGLASMF